MASALFPAPMTKTVRIWDLRGLATQELIARRTNGRYTNAKVVLVGDSGSGKTGITVRLAHDLRAPSRWPSTSGVWSTQWPMEGLPTETGWDRELWLWDFGGQADQRLIHQLYMDGTAAGAAGLRRPQRHGLPAWGSGSGSRPLPAQVVCRAAARRASGCRRRALAGPGRGICERPRLSIPGDERRGQPRNPGARQSLPRRAIPWGRLDEHYSPPLFKQLKEEILRIRDEGGSPLATFKELESLLNARLTRRT